MTGYGFSLFDTAIGRCAIVWGARGIAGLRLPEAHEFEMRARIQREYPEAYEAAPPLEVRRAQDAIVALFGEAGERPEGLVEELAAIPLDMARVPPFHRRVYELIRGVPPGATLSYGEVAAKLGKPGAARAVGQAMRRNPFPMVVPCHRVLAAGGRSGGFSANGGVETKLRMLALEGAPPPAQPALFNANGHGGFGFDPAVAVAHLRARDAALGRLIDAVGPFTMQLDRTPGIFPALAEAIVYQQLTGKAAATIFGRVHALCRHPEDGFTAGQLLSASDEELRGAGLSRSKLLSLRDLARRAVEGQLPSLAEVHGMTDEEVIERLTEVRGIGRWTVEMLLMFRLGRPDVLPVDDYGIRKGFALAFRKRDLPDRKTLEKRGARWKPYRTVASWYLWRAVDGAKQQAT